MYAVGGVIAGTGLFVGLAYYALRLPRSSRERMDQLLPWGKALVIGHRGESVEAPENTLAAFRVSKSNGVFGVEFDLSFTSDGHPVLLHDDSVDRTTDGSGEIDELTLAQVRKLNAAYHHKLSDKFGSLQVPILEEAIQECLRLNVTMFIDVKGEAAKSAAILSTLFQQYNLFNKAVVCSFNPYIVYKVKRADSRILTAITSRKWFLSQDIAQTKRFTSFLVQGLATIADVLLDWSIHSWLYDVCGCSVVLIHKDGIDQEYVSSWKDKSVHVIAWTVNGVDDKQRFRDTLKIPYITDCTEPGSACSKQRT